MPRPFNRGAIASVVVALAALTITGCSSSPDAPVDAGMDAAVADASLDADAAITDASLDAEGRVSNKRMTQIPEEPSSNTERIDPNRHDTTEPEKVITC